MYNVGWSGAQPIIKVSSNQYPGVDTQPQAQTHTYTHIDFLFPEKL